MCIKTNNKHLLNFSFGLILFLVLSIFSCGDFNGDDNPIVRDDEAIDIGNLGFFYPSPITTNEGASGASMPAVWSTTLTANFNYEITRRPENASDTAVTINSSTGAVTVNSNATVGDTGEYEITATVVSSKYNRYSGTNSSPIQITIIKNKINLNTLNFNDYTAMNAFLGRRGTSTAASWSGENAVSSSDGTDVIYSISSRPNGASNSSVGINSNTGELTVRAYATEADSGTYTITAYAVGGSVYTGSTTANITISITKIDLATLTFNDYADMSVFLGRTGTSTAASWSGENAVSSSDETDVTYEISSRPNGASTTGIEINSSTGVITARTSAVEADSGTYAITARAIGSEYTGTNTANITISMTKIDLATLTFNNYADMSVFIGRTGTSTAASWSGENAVSSRDGTDVTYEISSRPNGASATGIEINSSTGVITARTSAIEADSGTYEITARAVGSVYTGTNTADITISITKIDLAKLTFNDYASIGMFAGNGSATPDASWSDISEPDTSGRDVSYEISRVDGVSATISIDVNTGQITVGANSIVGDSGTYTITARAVSTSNYIGSQTASILISVFSATLSAGEYYKLASDGTPLGIQTGTWNANGLEASGTKWSCAIDSSGLIWEIKTIGGTRDRNKTYRWSGDGTYNDWDELVDAANTGTGLCGYTDWRVPSHGELSSLVIESTQAPRINIGIFPNTRYDHGEEYWSSTINRNINSFADAVNFRYGLVKGSKHLNWDLHVRLVRSD